MILLAVVIATGMKIVGLLLVLMLALVIIPLPPRAVLPRRPSRWWLPRRGSAPPRSPPACVAAGLFGSLEWDVPAGPAIVMVACAMFAASLLVSARSRPRRRE